MTTKRATSGFTRSASVLLLVAAAACNSGEQGSVSVARAESTQLGAADGSDPRLAVADSARIMGASGAKVWLVIVSDFQCPYCKQWHDSSGEAIRRAYVNSGQMRLAYVNYPLGQHQHAVVTSEAAMCAGAAGKFWEYHDALFATQPRWASLRDATPLLDSLARSVGLDVAAHKACRDQHVMLPLIEADRDRANAAGVRSTPTFLLDGERLEGVYPLPVMRPLLDSAVARAAR